MPNNFNLKTTIPVAFRVIICKEMSIHIFALQGVTIVAADNTVWIHDRNDPCLIQLTELVWKEGFREDKVQEAMYDEAWVSFAWMLSTNYYDDWFVFELARVTILVRDF